ncbi:MAG TPA: GDSL-type esterase/lipase family protein [Bryobacterales bacterium]|nr:GDSL-type esterase/lipase family protein [Bryobacterales bacterium]
MKRIILFFFAAALCAQQQPSALLNRAAAQKAYQQVIDLMDATSIAVPALSRAGQPLVENAKEDAKSLQSGLYNNSAVLYRLLTNVRVYLDLSDALPKPYPFAEDAHKQLTALRDVHERLLAHFRALLELKEQQLRNPDRDNLRRYAEADHSLPPPRPAEQRVVFLGDSITDGWRLNEYFADKPYVNRGISGQITGEMLGRMKADVIDLKPAAVLILAGTNDIARGVAVATIENNLSMIADLAVANHIKPIFASILPVSDYHKDQDPAYEMTKPRPPATILAINSWMQQMCRQRGFTYCNYFDAVVDKAGFLRADFASDGLHPNAAGYRAMGPVAQAAIDRTVVPTGKKKREKKLGLF